MKNLLGWGDCCPRCGMRLWGNWVSISLWARSLIRFRYPFRCRKCQQPFSCHMGTAWLDPVVVAIVSIWMVLYGVAAVGVRVSQDSGVLLLLIWLAWTPVVLFAKSNAPCIEMLMEDETEHSST